MIFFFYANKMHRVKGLALYDNKPSLAIFCRIQLSIKVSSLLIIVHL